MTTETAYDQQTEIPMGTSKTTGTKRTPLKINQPCLSLDTFKMYARSYQQACDEHGNGYSHWNRQTRFDLGKTAAHFPTYSNHIPAPQAEVVESCVGYYRRMVG